MGTPRTIGPITLTIAPGSPTPVFTGAVIAAATTGSFTIRKGIATIVLASALPTNGYNGPQSSLGATAGGQQVTLWGFTTDSSHGNGVLFNGKTVTVLSNNPAAKSFSFYFNAPDQLTPIDDPGNTAAAPSEHFRAVRIEAGQSNGSDFIYVGDLNVSSSRYVAALSLTGQLAVVISGDNIPADRIFLDSTADTDVALITLSY